MKAREEIEKICADINQRKKQAEKMVEVLRVQRSLNGEFKVGYIYLANQSINAINQSTQSIYLIYVMNINIFVLISIYMYSTWYVHLGSLGKKACW